MNHLEKETSPYLKQHAENPVDWYPWGKEALEKAKKENKPILLSIGYTACHWCHVMAHESFEDQATADLMNKHFVNIKVDREERPDLDKIYQTAHYFLTQRGGGWPLTIFLTPNDLTPFYSGTYFPLKSQYQLPAFKDVLTKLAEIYSKKPEVIKEQNAALMAILGQSAKKISPVTLNNTPIAQALETLQSQFDSVNGGFGGAPKFPQPPKLLFLLKEHSEITAITLAHMGAGGIYDQLGGGFFRYTVDATWLIPHFEKMLYDNAQLLALYAMTTKQNALTSFNSYISETAEWVMRVMQAEESGFYSSLDADSEGVEGKYYVWDKAELEKHLTPDEYRVIYLYYGIDAPANFEGKWHLHVSRTLDEVAQELKFDLNNVQNLLTSAREKLLVIRNNRTPPFLDKKILTSWNALMIKGMLIAGNELKNPQFMVSAKQALNFIKNTMWKERHLYANHMDDKTRLTAYLDDYAFLIDAILTALQIEWDTEYLEFAVQLADNLLAQFYDSDAGGFFFTANNHEKLLYRPKTMMDEALPSGNGIAAQALLTLGYLLGEPRYLEAAEKTLQAAWPYLTQLPSEHCSLLISLKEYLKPSPLIVLRGDKAELKTWQQLAENTNSVVFAIPSGEVNLPESLAVKKSQGKICAYICRGMSCSNVITNQEEFEGNIKN